MNTRSFFSQFDEIAHGMIFPGYTVKSEVPVFDSRISIASYMKPQHNRNMYFLEPLNIGYEIHFACSGSATNAFYAEFINLVEKYNHLSSVIIPITPKPTQWQRVKRMFSKLTKTAPAREVYDALKALVEYEQSGEFDAKKRKELIDQAAAVIKKYRKGKE